MALRFRIRSGAAGAVRDPTGRAAEDVRKDAHPSMGYGTWRQRAYALSALIAVLFAALIALYAPALPAQQDKGVLADLISRALSTPSTSVSIGAVDGVLSSDASISDIVLADRSGPWLKIDKVRLVWNRLALFRRRLEVDRLTLGHVQFLRRPLQSESAPPDATAPRSILPELPVKVIVKQFAVQEFALGEPVLGVAARLDISGKATLGPPSEGLDLSLTSRRLDAPGEFAAFMTYVPASNRLTLNVNSAEPAGGLFAHFANLPGLPAAKLAFNGAGALDNFTARLDFAAGVDIWAKGEVVIARQGAARRLTLDLTSRLEGLMPGVIRPVFAGETTLKGDVLFNDDSSIALPGGLHLVSASARLDFAGGKSADNLLDLKVHAGAIPGGETVGKLDLNASITGPLSGPTLEAVFDAGQIHVAEGSLDHVAATFRAAPNGPLTDATTRIAFTGDAKMSGLALADPALSQAVGPEVALTARGSASPEGEATFDALDLAAATLDAHYSGLLGAEKVHGKLSAEARDLSRFALVAGLSLEGEATIAADLDGAPRYGALTAVLDAHATGIKSGYPILDRIVGGELSLTGGARSLPDGGFGFSDLRAGGKHGSARLDGAAARDKVDLSARIDMPQAQFLDPRIAGKVEVDAGLTGALARLDANLTAKLSDGRLLDRPTSGLTLEAHANDITGLVDASASVQGEVDRQPLHGAAHLARQADGGLIVDHLALGLASAHLKGALTIGADRLADGELSFGAANLDDLSPLVLTKMSGALEARASASRSGGRQEAAIVAKSDRLSVGLNTLDGLAIDLTIADLWGARTISGTASLSRAGFGAQSIADVRLTATARPDSSDLAVSATARGLAWKAAGRLFGAPSNRFELASLSAQGAGQRLALLHPATFVFGGGGLDIDNLVLAVGAGRLSLAGHAGSTLEVRATAAGLPLSALDLAAPGLGLSGVADGEAMVGGTPDEPSGDWRVRLKGLSAPQTRSAALPALDVAGSGRFQGGRTSLDLAVNAGGGSSFRVTGSAPLAAGGALDMKIAGRIDAGLANNTLSVSGRHITGALAIDLRVQGTIAKPQASGSINLSDGSFRDDQTGLRIASIGGLILARGDELRIERLDGKTPNGGSIGATGRVRLDPAAGFPGALRLTGARAQLVASDTVTAVVDMSLDVAGALVRTPNVSGRITIVSMDITVPERLGGVSAPIPGTRHVNPTATARALLALNAKARSSRARAPLFNATLALTISAPNGIFVRGRGIDAEAAGDLRVSGSAANPTVTGGFDLLRGSLSLLGKRLVFTRGVVRFHGDATPELDLVAETSSAGITARIGVSGAAAQPAFTFTSTPSLPQDEILSRILFQNTSGNLSPFQALELANALASLTGRGDAFERFRRSLGVDSLDLSSGASGDPTVGVSRAISDRISVRATTGARAQDNGVSVDFDVGRHIRLQAGVDASGGSSAGVGADWEYK
ncbi:MAG TPA: translocation/assembly module TamB domain-containing protein [Roseiarcus sp.]|nr:translocation/assembly module TamB domain-containing protein [Roseiarcus sp.]